MNDSLRPPRGQKGADNAAGLLSMLEPEPDPPGIIFDTEPDGQLSMFINGLFNIEGPEFAF